jgi:hypothetical protein
MDSLNLVRDWLVPIATAISLISTAIAAWVGVLQYRVKVRAEDRLKQSSLAEMDTRLSKLFSELMWLAHARAGSHVSDTLLEQAIKKGLVPDTYFRDPDKDDLKRHIQESCILNLPVGSASQEAAIVSIAELGKRYEILREPARAALTSIAHFAKEPAEKALRILGS